MNDHDLLIRVDSKVDQLSIDIKDVKDGVNLRISNLEKKTIDYDKLIAELDPLKLAKMAYAHEAFIHDFQLRYKLIAGVIGFIGAAIWTLVPILLSFIKITIK